MCAPPVLRSGPHRPNASGHFQKVNTFSQGTWGSQAAGSPACPFSGFRFRDSRPKQEEEVLGVGRWWQEAHIARGCPPFPARVAGLVTETRGAWDVSLNSLCPGGLPSHVGSKNSQDWR